MAYIGKQPTVGNFVKLDAITTSATDTFNLTNGTVAYSPQSANHCIVSLNGVIQSPTTSFTISGSTIVFASALTATDVIDFILVLGDVLNIGTPSDGTVSFAKVTSNLITGATAETSIAGGDSVLIYDDSASALRKMTRTNFVSGIGGANTPTFHATRETSGFSIPYATTTEVIFNVEKFDTGSFYNTSNGRFTPTTAGKYFVYTQISWENLTQDTYTEITINKNGTAISRFRARNSVEYASIVASRIIELNGTSDYVSIFAYVEKVPSINVYAETDGLASYFGAYRIIE